MLAKQHDLENILYNWNKSKHQGHSSRKSWKSTRKFKQNFLQLENNLTEINKVPECKSQDKIAKAKKWKWVVIK